MYTGIKSSCYTLYITMLFVNYSSKKLKKEEFWKFKQIKRDDEGDITTYKVDIKKLIENIVNSSMK